MNEYDGPGADQTQEKKTDVKAKDNYLSTDWREVQAVKEIEAFYREAGRSDLLPWLRDWREAVRRLQADFKERITQPALLTLFQEGEKMRGSIQFEGPEG